MFFQYFFFIALILKIFSISAEESCTMKEGRPGCLLRLKKKYLSEASRLKKEIKKVPRENDLRVNQILWLEKMAEALGDWRQQLKSSMPSLEFNVASAEELQNKLIEDKSPTYKHSLYSINALKSEGEIPQIKIGKTIVKGISWSKTTTWNTIKITEASSPSITEVPTSEVKKTKRLPAPFRKVASRFIDLFSPREAEKDCPPQDEIDPLMSIDLNFLKARGRPNAKQADLESFRELIELNNSYNAALKTLGDNVEWVNDQELVNYLTKTLHALTPESIRLIKVMIAKKNNLQGSYTQDDIDLFKKVEGINYFRNKYPSFKADADEFRFVSEMNELLKVGGDTKRDIKNLKQITNPFDLHGQLPEQIQSYANASSSYMEMVKLREKTPRVILDFVNTPEVLTNAAGIGKNATNAFVRVFEEKNNKNIAKLGELSAAVVQRTDNLATKSNYDDRLKELRLLKDRSDQLMAIGKPVVPPDSALGDLVAANQAAKAIETQLAQKKLGSEDKRHSMMEEDEVLLVGHKRLALSVYEQNSGVTLDDSEATLYLKRVFGPAQRIHTLNLQINNSIKKLSESLGGVNSDLSKKFFVFTDEKTKRISSEQTLLYWQDKGCFKKTAKLVDCLEKSLGVKKGTIPAEQVRSLFNDELEVQGELKKVTEKYGTSSKSGIDYIQDMGPIVVKYRGLNQIREKFNQAAPGSELRKSLGEQIQAAEKEIENLQSQMKELRALEKDRKPLSKDLKAVKELTPHSATINSDLRGWMVDLGKYYDNSFRKSASGSVDDFKAAYANYTVDQLNSVIHDPSVTDMQKEAAKSVLEKKKN